MSCVSFEYLNTLILNLGWGEGWRVILESLCTSFLEFHSIGRGGGGGGGREMGILENRRVHLSLNSIGRKGVGWWRMGVY